MSVLKTIIQFPGAIADIFRNQLQPILQAGGFLGAENVDFLQVKLVGPETIRVIIGTGTTDAAAKPKIAYADVVVGDLATVSAWNDTLLDGGTNAEFITAMLWVRKNALSCLYTIPAVDL